MRGMKEDGGIAPNFRLAYTTLHRRAPCTRLQHREASVAKNCRERDVSHLTFASHHVRNVPVVFPVVVVVVVVAVVVVVVVAVAVVFAVVV
eukprot:283393-Pyramimonas_sp.AAC.1